jgi:hypothetical protein
MPRKTAPDWTEAEDEWLRERYPVAQNHELAAEKALDGWPRDEQAICRRARTLGLKKDPSRGYVRKVRMPTIWTPERDAWFREFVTGHTEREISAEHERVFGFPLRTSQIANRKTKLGLRSGTHGGRFAKGHVPANKGRTWDEMGISAESRERMAVTQFKAGQLPQNTRPLLETRTDKHGYTEIHVGLSRRKRANDQWIPLAKWEWMHANGQDWPEGCKAIHIDGDMLNDAADNIMPVPNELWSMVNGAVPGQLPWHDRETLEAAIAYARVTKACARAERKLRAIEGHPWACDARYEQTPTNDESAPHSAPQGLAGASEGSTHHGIAS